MNPTFTLKQIRAARPCARGWTKLLTALGYAGGVFDPERVVSLGDVAEANGAPDALWCVRCLDWDDISVRRAVIAGAVLPAVTRALVHTTDERVHECVKALRAWCDGDDAVDLKAAARVAAEAADAARAAWAAARAAAASAWAAEAVADAAALAARAAEKEAQRTDIIAVFPPIALAGEEVA